MPMHTLYTPYCTLYTHPIAHSIHTLCTPYTHTMHTLHTPYCTPYTHPMHTVYTHYAHPIHTLHTPYCTPYTHPMHTLYTPYTHPMHTLHTPYAHCVHTLYTRLHSKLDVSMTCSGSNHPISTELHHYHVPHDAVYVAVRIFWPVQLYPLEGCLCRVQLQLTYSGQMSHWCRS